MRLPAIRPHASRLVRVRLLLALAPAHERVRLRVCLARSRCEASRWIDMQPPSSLVVPARPPVSAPATAAAEPDDEPAPTSTPEPTATASPTPDATPGPEPETRFTSAPTGAVKRDSFVFRLAADRSPVTFRCRLDDGSFEDCAAVFGLEVRPGAHQLEAVAIDESGVVDPSPAVARWEALDPAPEIRIALPSGVQRNEPVTLRAIIAIAEDRTLERVEWELNGDGRFDDAEGATVEHAPRVSGPQTISAAVFDGDDRVTATATLDVSYPGGALPPVAEATTLRQSPAHDGFQPEPVAPPLERAWVADLGGATSSPVIGGGRAFFSVEGGRVTAVSLATGALLWSRIGGPLAYRDGTLYTAIGRGVLGLDPATGIPRWGNRLRSDETAGLVADGATVFTSGPQAFDSGTGESRDAFDAHAQGAVPALDVANVYMSGNCRTVALDRHTGVEQWRVPDNGCGSGGDDGQITLHEGLAFVGHPTHYGNRLAIDVRSARNGELVRTTSSSGPIAAADGVVLLPDGNRLIAQEAATGADLWTVTAEEGAMSGPVVAAGVAYVISTDGTVRALGLHSGTELWRGDLGGAPLAADPRSMSGAAIAAGTLVVSTSAGVVALRTHTAPRTAVAPAPVSRLALPPAAPAQATTFRQDNARSGWGPDLAAAPRGLRVRWTRSPEGPAESHALTIDGLVITALENGPSVRAVDATTGDVVWETTVDNPDRSRSIDLSLAGHTVIAQVAGVTVALDATLGRELWRSTSHGQATAASPLVVGNTVISSAEAYWLEGLDLVTGARRWRTPVSGFSIPLASDGVSVFGSTQYVWGMRAVAAADGSRTWTRGCGDEMRGGPQYSAGRVWQRDSGNGVGLVCDAQTGKVVDAFYSTMPPAIAGNLAVYAGYDYVTATDTVAQRIRWTYAIRPLYPPVITPAGVIVVSDDGPCPQVDLLDPATGAIRSSLQIPSLEAGRFAETAGGLLSDVAVGGGLVLIPSELGMIALEPAS